MGCNEKSENIMSEEQWIKTLHDNKKMVTQQEIINFEKSVEKLRINPISEELAEQLIQVFTDQTQHKEIMWSLVHLVESVNLEQYIGLLIKSTSDMKEVAPSWLATLYTRALNTPDARIYLKQTIKELSENTYSSVKDFLLQMLNEIEQVEERELAETFSSRIKAILSKE
jgi:hypothetical protein